MNIGTWLCGPEFLQKTEEQWKNIKSPISELSSVIILTAVEEAVQNSGHILEIERFSNLEKIPGLTDLSRTSKNIKGEPFTNGNRRVSEID